jgi:anti-sigma28 factor (negative regulator of flagellin synthesis)
MSTKSIPPTTTTDRPVLSVEIAKRGKRTEIVEGGRPLANDVSKTRRSVDTSTTQSLVEIGKNEARKHHEMLLSELREQIRSGTFQADMDVVAERVAEVLGEV